MKEALTTAHTAGLFIDGKQLKLAQLSTKNGKTDIAYLETFSLTLKGESQEKEHVKPLYTLNNTLPTEVGERFLPVCALDGLHTLVRTLIIKLGKQREIDAVLEFQAEPHLPFPIDQALLDSQTISLNVTGSQITLLAAQKEHVAQLIEFYHQMGIDPEVIESLPSSLAHFGWHYCFKETTRSYFVLHIGKSATECVLAKEGALIACHTIEKNLNTLSKQEERQFFIKEIFKTLSALSKQSKKFNPTQLLIVGEGANLLTEELKELPFEQMQPLLPQQCDINTFNNYSAAIALAFSAQSRLTHQINFRQKEFAFPNPWKRIKKTIALYLATALAGAAAFYFCSLQWEHYEEQSIKEKYVQLLADSGRNYNDFEIHFLKETKKSAPSPDELPAPQSLSTADINERLNFLQKEISNTPSLFSLYPKSARVSDFLAYLASHPNVAGAGEKPLLTLESISYAMTKRPNASNKKQSYQFRIEIEFTTPIPRLAREFHDALIAENDFVDPKEEVKWSASNDRYKVSFFLRERKPIKQKE